jgi:hypothetical protein
MRKEQKFRDWLLMVLGLFAIMMASGWTQSTIQDSVQAEIPTASQAQAPTETILSPIRIEAEMGTLDFGHRSFDNELRAKPKTLSSVLEELESAKKIRNLKKTLAKKSK